MGVSDDANAMLRLRPLRREAKAMRLALGWQWKAAPAPRPLYGLDRLALAPAAPVLVVEGEKTADAAAALFPEFVAVTWSGGGKAATRADWAPLAGRRVVILPDADQAGRDAAAAAQKVVAAAGADGVGVVTLPLDLPAGWDCADRFPDSFTLGELRGLIGQALAGASAGHLELPWGFRFDDDGLWFHEPGKEGEGRDVRLSDPFEVLGEARDPEGGGWAVVIRFQDRDGRRKIKVVKRASIAAEAGAVRADLAGDGLFIHPGRGRADRFAACLAEVAHTRRITLAKRTGWIDASRFVLPGGVIGRADAEQTLFDGHAASLNYREAGTLDGWQREIAARAVGNRLLCLSLSLAFLGPLLSWLDLEGGGFHLRGPSSNGKTSAAMASGSVWGGGGPLGFVSSWKATGNAQEAVALAHNETLLVLDEIGLTDPQECGATAYMLASGLGKGRMRQDGDLRKPIEWRVVFLSTGEISLADHMGTARFAGRTMAGQELRLLDIPADQGAGMGAWETLHGLPSPAALSDAIKAAAGTHYGHAGPAFLRGIVADRERWRAEAIRQRADFAKRAMREGDNGQIARAVARFGAVAAAGELAAKLGVVPWPAGTAQAAALACFEQWGDGFGRQGAREERQVIETVRNAIQANLSRFGRLRDRLPDYEGGSSPREGEARGLVTLGYTHDVEFRPHYLFHDAGWAEILKGFDLRFAADVLVKNGLMIVDKGEKRGKRSHRTSEGKRRFFTVSANILEYDLFAPAGGQPLDPEPPGAIEPGPDDLNWDADFDRDPFVP